MRKKQPRVQDLYKYERYVAFHVWCLYINLFRLSLNKTIVCCHFSFLLLSFFPSMNKTKPWKVLQTFTRYKEVTHEVTRIDYQTLMHIHPDKLALFSEWEKNFKIRDTRHALERMKVYINKPSRLGNYVELFQNEYDWICQSPLDYYVQNWESQLVELGFNTDKEICKAAYVYRMFSGRFLFFCVGMDYGLKTIYVTPEFKHRENYQGSKYLTIEEAECF